MLTIKKKGNIHEYIYDGPEKAKENKISNALPYPFKDRDNHLFMKWIEENMNLVHSVYDVLLEDLYTFETDTLIIEIDEVKLYNSLSRFLYKTRM
jgi:hypothetical protein